MGFLKSNSYPAVSDGGHMGWLFLLAIPDLCFAGKPVMGRIPADPIKISYLCFLAKQITFTPENDISVLRRDPTYIKRLRSENAKASSLANGIVDNASMLTKNISLLVNKIPCSLGIFGVELNHASIVPVWHKANVLAVRLVCVDEAILFCDLPHLRLPQITKWKLRVCKLFLRHRIEDIALVFGFVQSFFEEELPVLLLDSRIVARNKIITAQNSRSHIELVKFHVTITVDTRIGCDPVLIAFDEFADDQIMKSIREIKHIIWDSKFIGDTPGILDILERTAGA